MPTDQLLQGLLSPAASIRAGTDLEGDQRQEVSAAQRERAHRLALRQEFDD